MLESVCRVAIRSNSQTSNNHEPTNKVLSYSTHTHPHTNALSSQTHTHMCKRIHTLVSDNTNNNNNSESSQTHPYLTINPDTDRGLRVTRSHLLISLSHPSLTPLSPSLTLSIFLRTATICYFAHYFLIIDSRRCLYSLLSKGPFLFIS